MSFVAAEARRILADKAAEKAALGPKHWTLEELMKTQMEIPQFFVAGVLPEGLSAVVSPGKIGKSFLMSGVSISICSGANALGHLPTKQCEVLYIDLEQNPSKSKARWAQLLCGDEPPSGLHIAYEWKRLDAGGLEDIERFLDKERAVKVVIIDVFTKVKPISGAKGMNAYDQEYVILGKLKEIADRRRMAIVFVHHTNRTKSEDPLDSISGTNAMVGTPDSLWLLSRTRGKKIGKLYVTGRAAQEVSYELIWSPSIGTWTICGQEE